MKIQDHLRIIWAIVVKDSTDAIKNKIVQGILIGVGFMMLSSQALSLLVNFKDEPASLFWDQGKSSVIREIERSRELNFHAVKGFSDLESSVSQSAEPILGIIVPDDFDDRISESQEITINLRAYRSHWVDHLKIIENISFFEQKLSQLIGVNISINVQSDFLYPPPDGVGYPMMLALGVVLGVMTVGLILTPYLITDEKEAHTLDAILISPARVHHLLIGKSIVGLLYSLTASSLILLFSWRWIVHWPVIMLAIFLGGLCSVSIGLLLGASFENPTTVNMLSGLFIAVFLLPTYLWTSTAAKLPAYIVKMIEIIPSIAMYKIVRQSFIKLAQGDVIFTNGILLFSWTIIFLVFVGWRIQRLNDK